MAFLIIDLKTSEVVTSFERIEDAAKAVAELPADGEWGIRPAGGLFG